MRENVSALHAADNADPGTRLHATRTVGIRRRGCDIARKIEQRYYISSSIFSAAVLRNLAGTALVRQHSVLTRAGWGMVAPTA